MSIQTHIFFDFDDTLSDLQSLRVQYVNALSSILSSRYGSATEEWQSALGPALDASIHRYVVKHAGKPEPGYLKWIAGERAQVARELFVTKGAPLPSGQDLGILALELQAQALVKCNAAYPGVLAAINELANAGHCLCMASSQESGLLRPALTGMGMDGILAQFFGPDLVDIPKEGPEFYQSVFKYCGIRPSQAVVIDDQAMCLDWAEESGARVIQACIREGAPEPEFPVYFRRFAELPRLVASMELK
jgi:phosphoglycolate phosphatase-like HAD superfamily hydrolase